MDGAAVLKLIGVLTAIRNGKVWCFNNAMAIEALRAGIWLGWRPFLQDSLSWPVLQCSIWI